MCQRAARRLYNTTKAINKADDTDPTTRIDRYSEVVMLILWHEMETALLHTGMTANCVNYTKWALMMYNSEEAYMLAYQVMQLFTTTNVAQTHRDAQMIVPFVETFFACASESSSIVEDAVTHLQNKHQRPWSLLLTMLTLVSLPVLFYLAQSCYNLMV